MRCEWINTQACMNTNDCAPYDVRAVRMCNMRETVTTWMPWGFRNWCTRGSCLMSSSRVTRYVTCPASAVSRTVLSSGSRHIVSDPASGTSVVRTAMSSQNATMSSSGILYFRLIRGRRRTSFTSAKSGTEVTTSSRPASQASFNCAGVPNGFRNAETQMLESNSATGRTPFVSDFCAGGSDVGFDLL